MASSGGQLEAELAGRQAPPDEPDLGRDRPGDSPRAGEGRADDRPPLLDVEPLADAPALRRVAQAPVRPDDPDARRDNDAEPEHGLAREVGDLVERLPEDEAEDAEQRGPQPRADDAVGEELAKRQPRRPGDEGSDRADEADEPADEDRLAAVALEVALHLREPLLGDLDPGPVALEEAAPELAAEHEARRVAEHGARPDDPDQDHQGDRALAGDHAAGHDHGLAGSDQADEGARLEEREHADERGRSTGRASAAMSSITFLGSGSADRTPLA